MNKNIYLPIGGFFLGFSLSYMLGLIEGLTLSLAIVFLLGGSLWREEK